MLRYNPDEPEVLRSVHNRTEIVGDGLASHSQVDMGQLMSAQTANLDLKICMVIRYMAMSDTTMHSRLWMERFAQRVIMTDQFGNPFIYGWMMASTLAIQNGSRINELNGTFSARIMAI